MELAAFAWLLTPAGQALLEELGSRELHEAATLNLLAWLRRRATPEQARAALGIALARQRAGAKFPQAAKLYFTREALEQATAAAVAAHRARRLAPYGHVADLCCGAGADALALAAAGAQVTAVDRDPLRLALCRANVAALGLAARVTVLARDLLAEPPPAADVLFCDPGRRAGGRRRYSVAEYEPSLAQILAWRAQTPALGVKLGPGVDLGELPPDAEVEFVSLDGELKEAALWCGPLATTARRASVLRTTADGQTAAYGLAADQPGLAHPPVLLPPSSFLYEPDPAVLRAGLVAQLGARLGAGQLDAQIAYLTGPELVATPFARAWPILGWLPFNLKALRARLRELEAGPVTVKKRGSPLDTDALARRLSTAHGRPLVVVLTRVADRPAALVCAPPVGS